MSRELPPRQPWRAAGRVLAGLALLAYPGLVWFGLTHWRPRVLALVLLALLAPLAMHRLRGSSQHALRELALLPLVTLAALACAALLDAADAMLAVPVVMNSLLLLAFGSTLRRGSRPMVERFARLQQPALTSAQQAWCRRWTWLWCGFFLLNGSTALVLACFAPLAWWAFYNGLLAYLAMGLMFAIEWVLRRRRFGAHATAGLPAHDATPGPPAHDTAHSALRDTTVDEPAPHGAPVRADLGGAADRAQRAPDEHHLPDARA